MHPLLEKAHAFLQTAELLLEETDDSVSCVSRAYYAMLNAARALLDREGSSPKTHRGVFSEMGRFYFKTGRLPIALNEAFEHAEDARSLADYEAGSELTREVAAAVVADARAFVEAARRLLDAGDQSSPPYSSPYLRRM